MPAEKQNRIGEQLEGMRQLPAGFEFQPGKVWNKLEPQLKREGINYRAVFFAAASVIAVIAFLTIPFKKHKEIPVTIEPVAVKPKQQTQVIEVIATGIVEAQEDSRPSKSSHRSFLTSVPSDKIDEVIIEKDPLPVEIPVEIVQTGITPAQPVVAVTPAHKRRFPVAHINDLYRTESTDPATEKIKTASVYPFKKQPNEEIFSAGINREDESVAQKKSKSILPLINSSH